MLKYSYYDIYYLNDSRCKCLSDLLAVVNQSVYVCVLLDIMASNDMDEGHFHETERADYPNISQSGSNSKLSSDIEGKSVHNFHDEQTCMQPRARTTH